MRRHLHRLRRRDYRTGVPVAVFRLRRAALLFRIRRAAARVGSSVELDVAEDLRCELDLEVEVAPNTTSRLVIGPRCRIRRGVLIQLKGGTVELGERVELWRGVRLNVAGHFLAEGWNIVGEGTQVHCATSVRLGERATLGEYVTLADSSHRHGPDDQWVYHGRVLGRVDVGRNTWLAAKSTLGRGADVGDGCVVAANTLVTGTVPDGHFAIGVPATSRPRRRPTAPAP